MKKALLSIIFLLMFTPFIVKAETCDTDKITIESIVVEDSNGTVYEKSNATVDNKNINLDLSMHDVGDSITYKMVVKNDSSEDFEIDKDNLNSSSEYIKYTFSEGDDSVVVKSNTTKNVYLKIEYENEVPASAFTGDNYNIDKTLAINLSTKDSIVNPPTGVKNVILVLLVILTISMVSYVLLRDNPYLKPFIIIVCLIMIPIGIKAACKCDIVVNSNIEISKIAMFDRGIVVNSKLRLLSGDMNNIKSFKRSTTLPDSVRELANNQLALFDSATITDDEVNEELNRINTNGTVWHSFHIREENRENQYCYLVDDEYENCVSDEYIIYDVFDNEIIVLDLYESGATNYMMYDYDNEEVLILDENNIKNQLKKHMLFKKNNQMTMNILSTKESDFIIFGWYEDSTIYYYCEKSDVYLNNDSSYMFLKFDYLEDISGINNVNASKVENMNNMFANTGYETESFEMNLSSWNTSNVRSMRSLFDSTGYYAESWSIGDLSNWDVSNVENMSSMFNHAGGLTYEWTIGDLSNWNVSNVKDMSYMFNSAGWHSSEWTIGDLSNWNTSKVTSMKALFSGAGYDSTTWSVGNLGGWNVSNVEDMSSMFYSAGGHSTNFSLGDIKNWDVSSVKNIDYMFSYYGPNVTTLDLDLSGWNTSNITTMQYAFASSGYNSENYMINLTSWDTCNVKNMSYMFSSAGYNSTIWSIVGLTDWDVSNTTGMISMFSSAGYNAERFVLDLSRWDTSNVGSFNNMFFYSGYNSTIWSVGDLSNWKTSNVTWMDSMFRNAGKNATTWDAGSLSNWDTSKVETFNFMFYNAGYNAETFSLDLSGWDVSNAWGLAYIFDSSGYNSTNWEIGDLSNWRPSRATQMQYMFRNAGYNATTWNNIGTLKILFIASNINSIFADCPNAKATLFITKNISSYAGAFLRSATADDASIVVNYKSSVSYIDRIINTKSENSHVIKGELLED